jgi:hypothetical protein
VGSACAVPGSVAAGASAQTTSRAPARRRVGEMSGGMVMSGGAYEVS